MVARVPAQGEPFSEEELRAEAGAARHPACRRIVGDAGAERQVEVESTDPAAKPTELAIGEGINQVTEVQSPRVVGARFDLNLRVTSLIRVGYRASKARELDARFEREVLREVERVCSPRHPIRGVEVGSVIATHERELVSKSLRKEPILDPSVVATPHELGLQLLVDTLGARLAW